MSQYVTQPLKLCEDVSIKKEKDATKEQEAKDIYQKALARGEFSYF